MIRYVIPELSHVEKAEPEGSVYVTTDRRVGMIYALPPIDLESREGTSRFMDFSDFLERLKPGVTAKVIARTRAANAYGIRPFRSYAIEQLGWIQHELFLILEVQPSGSPLRRIFSNRSGRSVAADVETLRQSVDLGALAFLRARVLTEESEIAPFFQENRGQIRQSPDGLEGAKERIGVLRLWRQSQGPLDWGTLARVREELVAPYEIVVNLRRVSDMRAQVVLQRKRGHKAASRDSLNARGLETTEAALESTLLDGHGLLEVEWLLVLRRLSEIDLRTDVAQCSRVLERMGDILAEIPGAAPSWLATLPGTDPHHCFLELTSIANFYCPVLIRGEAPTSEPLPTRVLPLHRRDGSLYHFDLFRAGYDGANCLINGRRGKGKSVLANLISSSMLQDPQIRLIKVDVGSSYIKECELFGGEHVQFNLAEPSGLNPFRLLTATEHVEDATSILAAFLATLIQESKETHLSKELHGALERALLTFAEQRTAAPSLDSFLASALDLPRRQLLERFSMGGVFSNVLRERESGADLLANRYVYFNFERLTHAADEDFSQAVMAAVIATVNLEVLKAGNARRGDRKRVVFFADETPFFIQRNGRFFKLTTANFRKFGHGTVLIAQTTQDFLLPKEGGGFDPGILVNSPIRFFYQVDDSPEMFAERFGLMPDQMDAIQSLDRSERFREVFLQDELGGRVLRVAVTREEYWRVTSSRADNEKLQALRQAVPGLSLEEAIRCLSV